MVGASVLLLSSLTLLLCTQVRHVVGEYVAAHAAAMGEQQGRDRAELARQREAGKRAEKRAESLGERRRCHRGWRACTRAAAAAVAWVSGREGVVHAPRDLSWSSGGGASDAAAGGVVAGDGGPRARRSVLDELPCADAAL